MRTTSLKSGLALLAVFVVVFLDWFQAHGLDGDNYRPSGIASKKHFAVT